MNPKCRRRFVIGSGVVALVLVAGTCSAAAETTAGERLAALFADSWEFTLREDPLFATSFGDSRYDDRLPRETLADQRRRLEADRGFLGRLEQIPRDELSPAERINYDIFARLKRDAIAEADFQGYLTPITNRSGFHISFPELPVDVPLSTLRDYENYIARLAAFGQYVDDHIELLREGIKQGVTQPAVVLLDVDKSLRPHIVDDPAASLLYKPFERFPDAVPEGERARLTGQGKKAIAASVVSGYRKLLAFLTNEYLPACREQVGASALPRGRDFYRYRVHHFTTLDIDPQQVHDIGQSEVRRIKAEMEALIKRVGFQGDFPAFIEMLRTDPRFYADTPEQLLKEVSLVLKRMDGELPKLFGKLPRMSYGIREVPDFVAPRTTTAYYSPPSGDGRRAGFYYVNTYNLKSRPLFEIEALSLHEAVPGHHLQIAIAQELDSQPPFRRFAGFTAFVEGWGLYAERLGLEVGFYKDPYRDFGRLSYEMWRACRLVVDTGMHYLGWTRQQAIQFMADNTALSLHNITAEVDRYISWPGQATAYKMGELKIRELRRLAEERLKHRFDVRAFHDVVLGSGALPLDVLEANVRVWLDGQMPTQPASGE
ncbi:MAG: DUF885 domain-containing protein [Planctomycetia bacterium]|nr:DUF885 domain-containing protein [Planctomycetia bacterium]